MSGFVLHPDALTDLTEIWDTSLRIIQVPPTVSLTRSRKQFAPSSHSPKWATPALT